MNERQLKLFIRQAFSLENISNDIIKKTDPALLQAMARVREVVMRLPEPSLIRDIEWRKMQTEVAQILKSLNDQFAANIFNEMSFKYPELREQAQKMVEQISSTKVFPGTAGEIRNLPSGAISLQSVEIQESAKAAINSVKVNNKRLVDLFALQDADIGRIEVLQDVMTPWIKQNLKPIDSIVRTGILQGASTESIADNIGKAMVQGVRRRGEEGIKMIFTGNDATKRIRAQSKAIARTAIQDLNRQVNEQVWNANEFSSDLRWEWVAAFDSRTCQVCGPLDNIQRKSRSSFPDYPIHVNCRCQVILVDPSDQDIRAGIDVSPEKKFDKKGGREYKTQINVKGERLFRKAFDVKGTNPSYGDFLAQADRKTQGMFFGGGNAGSIRAERFNSFIKSGMEPRTALQKLITNAPRPTQQLRKIDIEKIKFKTINKEQ